MSEEKPKKRKMNILGYLSIAITLGIMIYSKFTHTEGTVLARLFNGVCAYGLCILGATLLTLLLYLGIHFANEFLNTIYDDNKKSPEWDNTNQTMLVFFVVMYVSDLAGWIKIL